jgi:hypothetical protein
VHVVAFHLELGDALTTELAGIDQDLKKTGIG